MHALEDLTDLESLMLISITSRSAALPPFPSAITGWMGALARARAATPVSDKERRTERSTQSEPAHALESQIHGQVLPQPWTLIYI